MAALRRKHTSPNLAEHLTHQRAAESVARQARADGIVGKVDPSSSSSLSLVPRRAKLLVLALLQLIRRCCDTEAMGEKARAEAEDAVSPVAAARASPDGGSNGSDDAAASGEGGGPASGAGSGGIVAPSRPVAPSVDPHHAHRDMPPVLSADPTYNDNDGGGVSHTDRHTGLVSVDASSARASRSMYQQNETVRQLSVDSADALLLLADYAMAIHDGGLANAIIRSVRRDLKSLQEDQESEAAAAAGSDSGGAGDDEGRQALARKRIRETLLQTAPFIQAIANALYSVQTASNANSRLLASRGIAGVWQRLLTFAQSMCGSAICAELAAEPILQPGRGGGAASSASDSAGDAEQHAPWLAGTDPCEAPSEWRPHYKGSQEQQVGRSALVKTCLRGLQTAVVSSLERAREAELDMANEAEQSMPERVPKITAASSDFRLGPGLLASLSVAPPRVNLLSLSDEMRELAALGSGEARLNPSDTTAMVQRLLDAAPFLRRPTDLQLSMRGNGLLGSIASIAKGILAHAAPGGADEVEDPAAASAAGPSAAASASIYGSPYASVSPSAPISAGATHLHRGQAGVGLSGALHARALALDRPLQQSMFAVAQVLHFCLPHAAPPKAGSQLRAHSKESLAKAYCPPPYRVDDAPTTEETKARDAKIQLSLQRQCGLLYPTRRFFVEEKGKQWNGGLPTPENNRSFSPSRAPHSQTEILFSLWATFGNAQGGRQEPPRAAGFPLVLVPDRTVTNAAIYLVRRLADAGPEMLAALLLMDAHWYLLYIALTCPEQAVAAKAVDCLMHVRSSMDKVCAAAGNGDLDQEEEENGEDGEGEQEEGGAGTGAAAGSAAGADGVRPAPVDTAGGEESPRHTVSSGSRRLSALAGVEARTQAKVRSRKRLLLTVRDLCDKVSAILNTLLPQKVNEARRLSGAAASAVLRSVHTDSARLQYVSRSRSEAAMRCFHHVAVAESSGPFFRIPAVRYPPLLRIGALMGFAPLANAWADQAAAPEGVHDDGYRSVYMAGRKAVSANGGASRQLLDCMRFLALAPTSTAEACAESMHAIDRMSSVVHSTDVLDITKAVLAVNAAGAALGNEAGSIKLGNLDRVGEEWKRFHAGDTERDARPPSYARDVWNFAMWSVGDDRSLGSGAASASAHTFSLPQPRSMFVVPSIADVLLADVQALEDMNDLALQAARREVDVLITLDAAEEAAAEAADGEDDGVQEMDVSDDIGGAVELLDAGQSGGMAGGDDDDTIRQGEEEIAASAAAGGAGAALLARAAAGDSGRDDGTGGGDSGDDASADAAGEERDGDDDDAAGVTGEGDAGSATGEGAGDPSAAPSPAPSEAGDGGAGPDAGTTGGGEEEAMTEDADGSG